MFLLRFPLRPLGPTRAGVCGSFSFRCLPAGHPHRQVLPQQLCLSCALSPFLSLPGSVPPSPPSLPSLLLSAVRARACVLGACAVACWRACVGRACVRVCGWAYMRACVQPTQRTNKMTTAEVLDCSLM